jgi:hypothetical protein
MSRAWLSDCALTVEDSPDGAESLRLLPGMRGARASVAPDGPEGVRLGVALRPRAAVVDIGLPGPPPDTGPFLRERTASFGASGKSALVEETYETTRQC